jgi:hypothetical protein
MVQLLMRRDGIDEATTRRLLQQVAAARAATQPHRIASTPLAADAASAILRPLHHTARRWRIPWTVSVLACLGAAVLAGYRLFVLLEPPGDAIRRALEAAAAETHAQLMLEPSPAVLAAMRRHFSGQDVSIATTPAMPTPIIAVTLHGLDRAACVEAAAKARRIDGPVVVTLQGYGAPKDCGSRNEMTWLIMP